MSEQDIKTNKIDDDDYKAGDIVHTVYGVGVIVLVIVIVPQQQQQEHHHHCCCCCYKIRLWRIPGRSMASASIAFLNKKSIVGRLPVAPGMRTTLINNDTISSVKQKEDKAKDRQQQAKPQSVLIHCYSQSRNIYIASYSENNSNILQTSNNSIDATRLIELLPDQVSAATTNAKLYPVIESLMIRAEQTATAVTSHIKNKLQTTTKVITQTGKVLLQHDTSITKSTIETVIDTNKKYLEDLDVIHSIEEKTADTTKLIEKNMKQLVTMIKDEEITVLLHRCKERIDYIIQNNTNVLVLEQMFKESSSSPAAAMEALEQTAGIKIAFFHNQQQHYDNKNDRNDDDDDASITDFQNEKTNNSKEFLNLTTATKALEQVLQKATGITVDDAYSKDLEGAKQELIDEFTVAYDSLQAAARSDRVISELFDMITMKTTEFQKLTGRILQTRSASLFLEGASRLQTRAAALLGDTTKNNQKFSEIFQNSANKLTKSFTEGDAAIARLKSIELGQAIKTKLINAIEVRSDALGGLDGIIAGALTSTANNATGKNANNIQNLVSNLQSAATTATLNAHETLISVLSSQSRYRDLALQGIEQTLCDLFEKQQLIADGIFGSNSNNSLDNNSIIIDPEQIAAIVRGEGGTAQIFEPIANRAIKQIEQQLDAAEKHVREKNNDPNNALLLDGLKRVRKLMSGELTLAAVLDEIVNVLNDEKVVAVGETLVQHGERVLDVIEGGVTNSTSDAAAANTNKVVAEALQFVEKAGITKENVMRELDQLNVNELLGTAESAVTDEKVRQQLISSATDTALDFVLKILPSMPVPPLEGVKDGLLYNLSNLSMKGFKVRKEDIQIHLAGMRATKQTRRAASTRDGGDTSTTSNGESYSRANSDREQDDDSYVSGMDDDGEDDTYDDDSNQDTSTRPASAVKATELLIINIQHISANLNNALWSFEQTYLPYLKGNGGADVKVSGGAIRLQFELRKQRKKTSMDNNDNKNANNKDDNREEWEPVLCLHDRYCSIAEIHLALHGEGRLTWILNKLASIFKGPLRDYVVRTIIRILSNQSGWILKRLNAVLSPYWDLILRTANLEMDDLVEADERVIISEEDVPDRRRIELVWRERLPLGMNLLMNDDSGLLKVVDFPRGSAARAVCVNRNLDPALFQGATILSVNGTEYVLQDELFEALKDPARPKTILFELAISEEIDRLLAFVEGPKEGSADNIDNATDRSFGFRKVTFTESGVLGIEFGTSVDNAGLVVNSFMEGDGGIVLAAAKTGQVHIGDLLTHINDDCVLGLQEGVDGRKKAIQLLQTVANQRPLTLTFVKNYIYKLFIEKLPKNLGIDHSGGPSEFVLVERQVAGTRRICVDSFNDADGMAENSGIFIGDHLVFVNGLPVGAGCRWLGVPNPPTFLEVHDMLQSEMNYPIGLTFARPMQQASSNRWGLGLSENEFSDTEAETICVTADSYQRLGCIFSQLDVKNPYSDIVVADFVAVPGIFQRHILAATNQSKDDRLSIKKLSIESVNGQFVPTYASVEMVRNALNRSWGSLNSGGSRSSSSSSATSSLELVLCDDDLKEWIKSQISITAPATMASE